MSAINKINVDNVSYNIEDSRVDNIADVIPTASTEQKGLVQIGQGINVDENGVISAQTGDSVSYTDVGGEAMSRVTIGTLNINGTDYNIAAPVASYENQQEIDTGAGYLTLGRLNNGAGDTYDIYAPEVSYDDYAQGADVLGILTVGGQQYPITCSAASGDSVQFNSLLASGTQIGTITINGVDTAIYAPAGGSGGGSTVSYRDNTSPEDQHRTVIGELTIDGAGYYIYAPSTISVEWDNVLNKPQITTTTVTPTLSSGTKIADIVYDYGGGMLDNYELYAPNGGSSVEPHFEVEIHDDGQSGLTEAIVSYVGDPMEPQVGGEFWNDPNFIKACNNPAIITRTDYTFKTIGIATFDTMEGYILWITLANPTYGTTNDAGSIAIGRLAATLAWDDVNNELVFESVNLMRGFDVTEVESLLQSGTPIANIKTNNNTTTLYAPAGGSGGDTVIVTPTVYSGTKIADIDVSGNTTNLYAPNSVTSINITPDLSSGTKIATIAWTDSTTNNSMDIYAPTGGSGGSVDWANVQNKPAIEPGTPGSGMYQNATHAIQQSGNTANGDYSIAIGYDTHATSHCAVAVGGSTQASGMWSVATGDGTIAAGDRQVAMGTYNTEDSNEYFAVMVGNGSVGGGRKNAEATAWNGNKYVAGNLYVGCTDWTTRAGTGDAQLVTPHAGGKRVLTEDDTVTVTQTLASGTKIAEIDVSGTTTDIYAPAGGATDWADITNKPDITSVAGRDGYDNIAGLGGSVNQYQGVNPKGTIVIGGNSKSAADFALVIGRSSEVTGSNGVALGYGAEAGPGSIGLQGRAIRGDAAALGNTTAASQYQTAIGFNNILDYNGQFGLIVGNGITASGGILPPSDAMAIGFDGNQYLAGDLYVNCTDFTTIDVGGGELNTANCGGTKVLTTADVAVAPILSTGTHIANITVNGTTSGIYAPTLVNANWNESDLRSAAYIQNKPVIYAGTGSFAVRANVGVAQGEYAFAENGGTAKGSYSHAEGNSTTASGTASHAEGNRTTASGACSHAEGYMTSATVSYAHAEGNSTTASGFHSHAEGYSTTASGQNAHAEGDHTTARGLGAHAEGEHTYAGGRDQHVQGKFNVEDSYNVFADIVGNGTSTSALSNAEATDWNGNKYLSGGIYVGCTNYTINSQGLTTLGAGGFRIDMAPDNAIVDPTEPDETISEDLVMIDTITKTMGSEMQEDPDNPGGTITVPTTVATTHQRSWVALPKEYTPRDLAVDMGILDEMEPVWSNYGTYTLQIWGVKRYANNGDGTYTEYCAPVYQWVKTADTTPRDETDPTPEEEPTE